MVQFALETSAFACMGRVFTQTRGACMGSPIAPILCSIVVTYEEYMWKSSYASICYDSIFMTRYVDNRLIIAPNFLRKHPGIQLLASLDFYIPPICLEHVGNDEVLGFFVSIENATITYKVPSQSWQFRSEKSAASERMRLAGLASRLHIISRCAYPRSNVRKAICQLLVQCKKAGFTVLNLLKTTNRIMKSYNLCVSPLDIDNAPPIEEEE